jgi:hypothetical protein
VARTSRCLHPVLEAAARSEPELFRAPGCPDTSQNVPHQLPPARAPLASPRFDSRRPVHGLLHNPCESICSRANTPRRASIAAALCTDCCTIHVRAHAPGSMSQGAISRAGLVTLSTDTLHCPWESVLLQGILEMHSSHMHRATSLVQHSRLLQPECPNPA